jgi:hypothetical protein
MTEALNALVGTWTIEAREHPDFPDALSRDAPGFWQRFTGTVSDDGSTLSGLWKLSCDDGS